MSSTDLESLNVASLRSRCKSRHISPIPKKKQQLVAALTAWEEEHGNKENVSKSNKDTTKSSNEETDTFKAPEPKKQSLKRNKSSKNSNNENENDNSNDNTNDNSNDKDDSNDEFREPAAKRRKITKNNDNNNNNKSKSKSPSKSKSKSTNTTKSKTKSKTNSTDESKDSVNDSDDDDDDEAEDDDEDDDDDDDDDDDMKENVESKNKSKTKSKSCNSGGGTDGKDLIKIVCFNINGVRASCKHGLAKFLESQNADLVCFSEMKADLNQNPMNFDSSYQVIWNECTEKKGYAGSCILTKLKPISIVKGIGCEDGQGRAIIVEFDTFYVVNTYVPNSGQKLKFEKRRKAWDIVMKKYLKQLQDKKPVIWTGDLNVAIEDWDVYDGESNKARCKTAGFTPYERQNFRSILSDLEMVDSWRELHPESRSDGYTFFTARSRGKDMKKENLGWRLDYFVVSKKLMPLIEDITIEREASCSDHVPLVLTLKNPNNNL